MFNVTSCVAIFTTSESKIWSSVTGGQHGACFSFFRSTITALISEPHMLSFFKKKKKSVDEGGMFGGGSVSPYSRTTQPSDQQALGGD